MPTNHGFKQCDEGQPQCARCVKGGWQCEYFPWFQFRDENSRFGISTIQHSSHALHSHDTGSWQTELNVISTKSSNGSLLQKLQLIRSSSVTPGSRRHSPSPYATSPSLSPSDELVYSLTHALEITAKGYRLQYLGAFVCDVPSRIGQNAALDAAVACLVQSHRQLLHGSASTSSPSSGSSQEATTLPSLEYMSALRTLQEVIEHPVLGTSSETLCATIFMSYYEVRTSISMVNYSF